MGKKSRRTKEERIAKLQARAQTAAFVPRPFEGLPFEADLVAMRELVPAATATAKLNAENGGEEVVFATLLPGALQAMRRGDGVLMAGLQVPVSSTDPSRDLAAAILQLRDAEPEATVEATTSPGQGPRLQDILDLEAPFTVSVAEGFDYWVPEGAAEENADLAGALEEANGNVSPTERLRSVEGAYWTNMGGRVYVRWAMSENEDKVMNGLARLHAAGENTIGGTGKYLGTFRAHGIVAPVWELDASATVDDVDVPMGDFAKRLRAAVDATEALDYEQRRAKAGVVSRQLTIR